MTTTRCTTIGGITRQAGRFITATDSIEANASAAITIALKELRSPLAGSANAPTVITTLLKERYSLPAGKVKVRAALTTDPKGLHSLSPATGGLLAGMPSLVPKAMFTLVPSAATAEVVAAMPGLTTRVASAPAPSAASALAGRNGVFRRAEAPASAAVSMAVDATERIQL